MTFSHFSTSERRKRPNSSGVLGVKRSPSTSMRRAISGSFMIRMTSEFMRRTISFEVPAGANSPIQLFTENPGTPDSAIVGRPGAAAERSAPVHPRVIVGDAARRHRNDEADWLAWPALRHRAGRSCHRRLVFISGLLARDAAGNIVGKGDMGKQLEQVGENLRVALEAAGAGLVDLVRTTTYVTDIDEFFRHVEVRQRYFGPALPTSTTVEVRRLSHQDFLVEVEAFAALPR